jgi:hypothetical protein
MHTIGEVIAHFAAGAELVTLKRAAWGATIEIVRQYSATENQRSAASRGASVRALAVR